MNAVCICLLWSSWKLRKSFNVFETVSSLHFSRCCFLLLFSLRRTHGCTQRIAASGVWLLRDGLSYSIREYISMFIRYLDARCFKRCGGQAVKLRYMIFKSTSIVILQQGPESSVGTIVAAERRTCRDASMNNGLAFCALLRVAGLRLATWCNSAGALCDPEKTVFEKTRWHCQVYRRYDHSYFITKWLHWAKKVDLEHQNQSREHWKYMSGWHNV